MTHLDDDVLAAIAMEAGDGDDWSTANSDSAGGDSAGGLEASAHLADCLKCQAELEQYRFILQLARDSRHEGDLLAPRASLLYDVMVEITGPVVPFADGEAPAEGSGPAQSAHTAAAQPAAQPVGHGSDAASGAESGAASGAESGAADNVVSLQDRRTGPRMGQWRQAGLLISVAAAAAVVGWGLGSASEEADEVVVQPAPDAVVELATLDTAQTLGEASVVRTDTATDLVVSSEPLDAGDGFLEVWLINVDGTRMVSVGVLDGTEATFPISDDLLAQGYRIVDISQEQFDDQPAHSGQSLVRGTLPA